MKKDKNEIRAYYETNYISVAELQKMFDVKKRTLYHWIKTENWEQAKHIKNKDVLNDIAREEFGSKLSKSKHDIRESIEAGLISDGIPEAIAKATAKRSSDNLLLKAMSVEFIDSKAMEALLIAKNAFEQFASDNLNNPKTSPQIVSLGKAIVDMYSQVKTTIHGKSPEVNVNIANITPQAQDFKSYSDKELLDIIAKSEISDE
ncbi:hypothetical protein [Helicobacter sp. 11S02596-1]|uniref:hypothetical protein n=1 Tax=Helicobacter sp. 11S02596-1 TaxID=1476194 RepID=UPI000BA5C015|nr:hypothetical protein [Helicobacter sp. 11S02596-1]PAF41373.1 hypothetical protein BJI48_08765 [Helicobacter sp. 11S02596-1]